MTRTDIINLFIKNRGYTRYLEIGYYKGWSFEPVINANPLIDAEAVDPNPCQTPEQQAMPYGESKEYNKTYDGPMRWLIKLTSDDYFNRLKRQTELAHHFYKVEKQPRFDIVFIDGLHESNQVYKDIMNSLDQLAPGGTIIMHDCKPEQYNQVTTGDHAGNWVGDTYKAFLKFRFTHPEYNAYVVDTDWGCGVIETPPDTTPGYIDGLYKGEDYRKFLEWDEFEKDKAGLLNLISVEEFKTRMDAKEAKNTDMPA